MIKGIQFVEEVFVRCVRLPAKLRLESVQHNPTLTVRQSPLPRPCPRLPPDAAAIRSPAGRSPSRYCASTAPWKPASASNAGPCSGTSPPANPRLQNSPAGPHAPCSTRSSAPEQKNLSLFTPSSTFFTGNDISRNQTARRLDSTRSAYRLRRVNSRKLSIPSWPTPPAYSPGTMPTPNPSIICFADACPAAQSRRSDCADPPNAYPRCKGSLAQIRSSPVSTASIPRRSRAPTAGRAPRALS
jgi:hypothetical protein